LSPASLGSYEIPKGTWVVLSAYITHRIPEIFPEPYRFKPDRWLSIHPSAYEFMSFSAGPRYCIGQPLAMMQLKIALSIILQRFVLTVKPGTIVECVGMNSIRPRHGLPMIVHEPGHQIAVEHLRGNIRKIVEFENNP
jgi:cytochrome P450